jgi:hypothetical protein
MISFKEGFMASLMLAIFVALFLVILVLGIFLAVQVFRTARGLARMIGALTGSRLPRSVARSLRESRRYGRLIIQTAGQYPSGPIRDRLNLTIEPVDKWLTNLTRLEQALEKLYSQRNIARELRQTKFEFDNLQRRLLKTDDNETRLLQELMVSKKQHLAALKELHSFQTQAELKVRKITSDLGVTHAEMLLIIARGDFNENRLRRLDESLQDQLSGMRDILTVMEESGYSRALG